MYSWVNQRLDRRWPNRGLNPVYVKRSQITFQKLLLALCCPPSIKSLIIPKSECRNPKSEFYTRANRFIETFCFVGYYAAFSSCLICCLENYFTHSISVGTDLAVDTERIKVQLLVESPTPSLRCMVHAPFVP